MAIIRSKTFTVACRLYPISHRGVIASSIISLQRFAWGCQLIHKNCETFLPQTFLVAIWFYENTAKTDHYHYYNHPWQLGTYLSILKSVGFLKQTHRNLSKEGKQLSTVVQYSSPVQ